MQPIAPKSFHLETHYPPILYVKKTKKMALFYHNVQYVKFSFLFIL